MQGWSREESDILRRALIKFGIGNWKNVLQSRCLPGKSNAQLNLQLQRLLGQQSTAEFQGLHIDPQIIGELNALKTSDSVKRKGGCIINTDWKLTKKDLERKLSENKMYEVNEDVWSMIDLHAPKVEYSTSPPVCKVQTADSRISVLSQEISKLRSQLNSLNAEIQNRIEYLKISKTVLPDNVRVL